MTPERVSLQKLSILPTEALHAADLVVTGGVYVRC